MSQMFGQEKSEKNGMSPGANGKLSAMSPRAHRLLIVSAKGSMNGESVTDLFRLPRTSVVRSLKASSTSLNLIYIL